VDYRVEQLAAATSLSVDTLRFYQARGLLSAPRRDGRTAIYSEEHLERLKRIRSLQEQGFTLSQIQRVIEDPDADRQEPLLTALRQQSSGRRALSRDELAGESGVPVALIAAAQSAGLVTPVIVDGEPSFNEADVGLMRAGRILLEAGLPLQQLLGVASGHARNVEEVCDAAIDLFDDHIRKGEHAAGDSEAVTAIFEQLLPEATRLVALHFQRTLVNRALNRLQGKKEHASLAKALAEAESAKLVVDVSWS
jgi:DNA-binding transcriptional MerR regulator